jgi:hypothetical protein
MEEISKELTVNPDKVIAMFFACLLLLGSMLIAARLCLDLHRGANVGAFGKVFAMFVINGTI